MIGVRSNMSKFVQEFHFDQPFFLTVIPFLVILFFILNKKEIVFSPNILNLKRFASIENLKLLVRGRSFTNAKAINLLLLVLFILLTLSLAKPRWGFSEVEHYDYDKNLVVLLDSSQSMAVEDLGSSRFTRAKQEIYDILQRYQEYRVGVISFTDIPYIISPLTKDHKAIIDNIKSLSPDDFELQGSNINEAFKLTINYLKKVSGTEKYILLISDGGFTTKLDAKIVEQILDQKLELFIYAIGTELGGPVFKDGKIIEYEGEKVISKLDLDNLNDIAKEFKAKMITVSYDDFDIDEFSNFITRNQEITKNNIITKQWKERFYVFLVPAMLILLFFFSSKIFLSCVILYCVFNINNAEANIFLNNNQNALGYYKNKEYSKAEEKFSSFYNKGVASYRNKDYAAAIEYFNNDILKDDIKSQFNKGNAHFMQKQYGESIESYKMVLENDPDNKNAQYNLKIAQKMLQKQPPSKSDNNADKEPAENKKEDKKNSDSKKSQKSKKQVGNSEKLNADDNIFNLVETDSGTLLKKKIRNKEENNKEKFSNNKPW